MTETSQVGTPTLTMAYAGRRLTNKDTLAWAWQVEGEDQVRLYGKPLVSGLVIGTEVEFLSDELHRVIVDGHTILPQIDNDEKVAEWSVGEKIDIIRHGRILDNKRRAKLGVDPLDDAIVVLRDAYRQIPRTMGSIGKRSAFIDYVTTAIQG